MALASVGASPRTASINCTTRRASLVRSVDGAATEDAAIAMRGRVSIDMDQVGLARMRSVSPGKHEGRRNDGAGTVQSLPETLSQRRLARAELSRGHDQITAAQHLGQPRAQPLHILGGWHFDRHRKRLGQDHAVWNRAGKAETAVVPKGDQVGQLLAGIELCPPKTQFCGVVLGRGHHGRGNAVPLEVWVN